MCHKKMHPHDHLLHPFEGSMHPLGGNSIKWSTFDELRSFRFFLTQKSVTRSTILPLSQKVTLAMAVRLQEHSQRLLGATFLRDARVQIPPLKTQKYLFHVALTNKNRDFDTMGIKVTVLNFCLCYGLFQLL